MENNHSLMAPASLSWKVAWKSCAGRWLQKHWPVPLLSSRHCQDTLELGVHLTAPGLECGTGTQLLCYFLLCLKQSTKGKSQLCVSAGHWSDVLRQDRVAWFALRRDAMAATAWLLYLFFISVFSSRFPGACLKLCETPLEVLCI